MSKLACVDNEGAFQSNLVEDMVAYASGTTIEVEETEAVVENVGTTAYQAMEYFFTFLSCLKPNKWLKRVKEAVDDENLPTTGIEKAKDMFKELRKITLKSLPQEKITLL